MPGKFGESESRILLARLAESHGRLYYKLAYGVLRDAEAAHDACQQAWLKALERLDELRSPQAIRSWLAKVVVNEALWMRRRRGIEAKVVARRAANLSEAAPETGGWILRDDVLEALEKLPEETRMIVLLRKVDGLSGIEVKELLDCNDTYVSRHLHRGMDLLRELLQEWRTTVDQ